MTVRALLLALAALLLASQALTAAHAHEADEPVVCEACTLADRADEAGPVPSAPGMAVPIAQPVAHAFAARAAIVPTVTAHPPGRAPPLDV